MPIKKIKIICVVGARPNFIKIAPLMEELNKRSKFDSILVHTGQHYDRSMSEVFFKDLNIPTPDYNLEIGSALHGEQTGRVMIEFEKVCLKEKPNLVIVIGDVNSTLACALVASKMHIPVAHIESGLRSFDKTMPEEINRILTDHVSDYLFTICDQADKNLINEGIVKNKIFFVGDILIDSLFKFRKASKKSKILKDLFLENKKYALLTLHRPINVDNKDNFKKILDTLSKIQENIKIVYPVHPRTKKRISNFGFSKWLNDFKNLIMIPPANYLDMIALMSNSKFIMTDSGGIQEESSSLNVPCLTLRNTTERPLTVYAGTNTLVGNDENKIMKEFKNIMKKEYKKGKKFKYWDGKAAKRIVGILEKNIK